MGVVGIDITARAPLADGASFGSVGPYEQIQGTLRFAADPQRADHQVITDLGLAPTEADGRVHFQSEFVLLKPMKPAAGGSVLYDVINRGNRTILSNFNEAAGGRNSAEIEVGNGFLMRHGFTLLFCGWQTDVPAGLRLAAPEALENGKRIRGQAFIQYSLTKPANSLLLSDAGHQPLSVADGNDPAATLTVRDYADGIPQTIQRSTWGFGRWENGQVVADPTHVYLSTGFQPGKVYEIIYTTEGAPVIGLGFLAMRDSVGFLKYGSAAEGNPSAGSLDRAFAFGSSMSGRVLREFIYLGLNADEADRQVFDGVLINTASSRRGEFNLRFGQPSTNIVRSPSSLFPMTYTPETDPVTGKTGGLLDRTNARGVTPKIIATNSGVEYWWSGASLAHTDAEGTRDVAPPAGVRVYDLAGTQHGPGSLPLSDVNAAGTHLEYPVNTVDYRPILRAALLNLEKWTRSGDEPPPSQHPRIADGTAVKRESLEGTFKSFGVQLPLGLPLRRRLDFGAKESRGILEYPPEEGPAFGTLVSGVDADGNEVGGVRPVDVRVPLATYAGWNRRHADIGGDGYFIPLIGSTHVFPKTAEERARRGDPRSSIQERYGSRDGYLSEVRKAAAAMMAEGHLLEEDLAGAVAQAADRYDAFTSA